jgi:hypothetical protein
MLAWVKQPDVEFLPKPGKLRELAQVSHADEGRGDLRARPLVCWPIRGYWSAAGEPELP